MQLFRRTLLQGAHDRLVDAGRMLPFANEKLATEVFDKIASDMGIPPILSERPNQQQALALGNSLIDYSQKLAANGHGPDNELMGLAKQASTKDPAERALVTAEYYIQKAAEEGSIRDSGGTGLLAAGGHDPMARLDLMNRATGAYAVQQGQSNFPMPGVLGRELAAPGAPGTGANVSQKIAENDLTIEQLRARSEQMANAARQQSSMAQPAAIRGSAVVPSAIQGFWTEAPSGSGGRLPSSQSWTNALDASSGVQGYEVGLGSVSGGPYVFGALVTPGVGTTSVTLPLPNGVAQFVVVRAKDNAGNTSVNSTQSSGTPRWPFAMQNRPASVPKLRSRRPGSGTSGAPLAWAMACAVAWARCRSLL